MGLLKQENVNICLERVTVPFLEKISELAKKNTAMAEKVSAKGFGILLAGAAASAGVQEIVCDTGSGELAVMTGLVDVYACGLPSRARNAANGYHTVFYFQENGECDENKIMNLFERCLQSIRRARQEQNFTVKYANRSAFFRRRRFGGRAAKQNIQRCMSFGRLLEC